MVPVLQGILRAHNCHCFAVFSAIFRTLVLVGTSPNESLHAFIKACLLASTVSMDLFEVSAADTNPPTMQHGLVCSGGGANAHFVLVGDFGRTAHCLQ
jgi:hypothetical protein